MAEEPKAPQAEITANDFSVEARTELTHLANIEALLKKVKGLEGDEAFAYVAARQFLAEKAGLLRASETARIKAQKAKAAAEAALAEAPKLAAVPLLAAVPPSPADPVK